MNRLEELVRDSLAEHAHEAPDGSELVAALRREHPKPRREWLLAGLAAAVVIAAVAATVVVVRESSGGHRARPTATGVPTGMWAVSFHGIEILVPDSWRSGTERCRQMQALDRGFAPGQLWPPCGVEDGSATSGVDLSDLSGQWYPPPAVDYRKLATTAMTIDGHAARRGVSKALTTGEESTVIALPDPGVLLLVRSPDPALVQRIVDSIRVVSIDSRGCESRMAARLPESDSTADGNLMMRQGYESAVLCSYSSGWLERSTAMPADKADSIVAALNALSLKRGPHACLGEVSQDFVLRFSYPDGQTRDVLANGTCAARVTNGVRVAAPDSALIDQLARLSGYTD
jgi:hypothetical protein